MTSTEILIWQHKYLDYITVLIWLPLQQDTSLNKVLRAGHWVAAWRLMAFSCMGRCQWCCSVMGVVGFLVGIMRRRVNSWRPPFWDAPSQNTGGAGRGFSSESGVRGISLGQTLVENKTADQLLHSFCARKFAWLIWFPLQKQPCKVKGCHLPGEELEIEGGRINCQRPHNSLSVARAEMRFPIWLQSPFIFHILDFSCLLCPALLTAGPQAFLAPEWLALQRKTAGICCNCKLQKQCKFRVNCRPNFQKIY